MRKDTIIRKLKSELSYIERDMINFEYDLKNSASYRYNYSSTMGWDKSNYSDRSVTYDKDKYVREALKIAIAHLSDKQYTPKLSITNEEAAQKLTEYGCKMDYDFKIYLKFSNEDISHIIIEKEDAPILYSTLSLIYAINLFKNNII